MGGENEKSKNEGGWGGGVNMRTEPDKRWVSAVTKQGHGVGNVFTWKRTREERHTHTQTDFQSSQMLPPLSNFVSKLYWRYGKAAFLLNRRCIQEWKGDDWKEIGRRDWRKGGYKKEGRCKSWDRTGEDRGELTTLQVVRVESIKEWRSGEESREGRKRTWKYREVEVQGGSRSSS